MTFGRMAVLQDPTGAVFAIWQPRESIGAQVVNDPGALTMNQVNTTDTDAVESLLRGAVRVARSNARPSSATPTARSSGASSTAIASTAG